MTIRYDTMSDFSVRLKVTRKSA